MIAIGLVLAIAAGITMTVHSYLFGRVIDLFVYFNLGSELMAQTTRVAESFNLSCDSFIRTMINTDISSVDLLCP